MKIEGLGGKAEARGRREKGKKFVGEMEWKNVENCGFFPT
jgi:hypothetical protein